MTDEKRVRRTKAKGNNSKKRKKKKRGMSIGLKIFLVILVVAVVAISTFILKMNSIEVNSSQKNAPEQKIEVTVEDGATVGQIIDSLYTNGVIDNVMHFKFLCRKLNYGSEFKSGVYQFNNHMNFNDIVAMLNKGAASADAETITIKEGQWLKEIAANLEEQGICSATEFMEAANSRDYDYDFVKAIPDRENLLEGYLFPETYAVEKGMSAHDIVNMMLKQFDKIIKANDIEAKAKALNHTLDEEVAIASLIEGEVRYPDERATVASVIYNRLSKNMKLQLDASVLYSMGARNSRVYEKDLQNPDKHNTYVVDGLPIGPINNPSEASLVAAVNPQQTNYLFYVVENQETGQHHFSESYDEFLKAKEKYLSQN